MQRVLSRQLKSKQEISVGDVKIIEIEYPKEVGYDGRFETIAESRAIQKQKIEENQRI